MRGLEGEGSVHSASSRSSVVWQAVHTQVRSRVTRNMPIVQRMYQAQAINFSLPPRLFLLAPQFSPLLRRVVRQIIRPQTHWVRYHTVDASGGPGILFEPVVGE